MATHINYPLLFTLNNFPLNTVTMPCFFFSLAVDEGSREENTLYMREWGAKVNIICKKQNKG